MKTLYLSASLLISAHLALAVGSVSAGELVSATTGIIAFNSMAFSLILAARWRWIDALLGGADKAYQWHRWFGYSAVIASIGHWLSADDALTAIVPALSDTAGDSGEFAVFTLLLLGGISALKIIPYHWWKKSHLLMGPLFLVLVFHSFFSDSPIPMDSFLWWNQLNLALLGIIAWLFTLVNLKNPTKLQIKQIQHLPGAIDIRLIKPAGFKFQAGQFASISVDKCTLSEAHPFTIASAPHSDELRFIINRCGDYTQLLATDLKLTDQINIHRIGGGFVIPTAHHRQRQLWIGAGVGITPFLAALASLKSDQGPIIELIYAPGQTLGQQIIDELQHYENKLAQFKLYILDRQQRLAASHFNLLTSNWQSAQLYLCGPDSLKQSARHFYLQGRGLGVIKDENFDFRHAQALNTMIRYMTGTLPKMTSRLDAITVLQSALKKVSQRLLPLSSMFSAYKEQLKNANFVTRR